MTHPYIPPQPGGPGAYEQQLTARAHRAEQDRATLETELGQARQRNAELQQRAERAEAALSRVQAQCERWRYTPDRKRAAEEMLAELDRAGDHVAADRNVIRADEPPTLTARYLSYPRPACTGCGRAVHAPLDCDQASTLAMSLDSYLTAQIKAMQDEGQP